MMDKIRDKRILFISSENFAVRFRERKEAASLQSKGAYVKFLGVGDIVPSHLRTAPFPVEIIAPNSFSTYSTAQNRIVRILQNLTYYPCKRVLIPYARRFDLRHRWLSKNGKALMISAKKWNPDVIHCADAPSLGYAAHISKKLNVPMIYDCHEWWQGVGDVMDLSAGSEFLNVVIGEEKKFATLAYVTFTTSREMSKKLQKFLGLRNTVVLYNAIPFPDPQFIPVHKPMKFVFHGTLAKNRGIFELLEAFSKISGNAELFFHGNFSDITEEECVQFCQQLSISDKVHFCGPFEYCDIYNFLKEYDVAVWSSAPGKAHFDTTLPNKFFDAVCSGLAIAMPNYKPIQDILKCDSVGRTIETQTVEDITAALQYFLNNPSQVADMKKKSVSVSKKYSWDAQEQKLLSAYSDLFMEMSNR